VSDEVLTHGATGFLFGRTRIEVREGPGEHHPGDGRVLSVKATERFEKSRNVGARIDGWFEGIKLTPQKAEALEEDLTNKPGFVPEQLVNCGDRCRGSRCHVASRELADAVGGNERHCRLQDVVAQLLGSLLRPRQPDPY
jgi:hypothetical protein